jgi:hypothetical protein
MSASLPGTEVCPGAMMDWVAGRNMCVDPAQGAEKTCPAGYAVDPQNDWTCKKGVGEATQFSRKQCPPGFTESDGDRCVKIIPTPSCPAGSTFHALNLYEPPESTRRPATRGVCIPNTTASYMRPPPEGSRKWPCDGTDPVEVLFQPGSTPQMKCYSAPSRTPAAGARSSLGTMDELRSKYMNKTAEYDAAIQQALATNDSSMVARIRQMNTDIAALLDKMIESLTFTKSDTPLLIKERDGLVEKLRRIQLDYNGLLVNTDTLETLRRIREQEGGNAKRDLYRYLALFFVLCVGVILMIFFVKRGGQSASTATSAATPSMTPPLT